MSDGSLHLRRGGGCPLRAVAPEPEAAIERTQELGERLHVDEDANGLPVGVEILYPSLGDVDLEPLRDRYGLDLKVPFRFAA